jgi:hypothetical protein
MRNGILRDVIFACAGGLMVMAVIGLPGQGTAVQQQWQMQFQGTRTHLLPCYWVNSKPPPPGPAVVRPLCQKP